MKPGVGLIARKIGMTLIFREDGRPVPVTVLASGPCVVVQTRTVEKDGYRAVQLGFEEMDPKRVLKPQQGHFAKAKVAPKRVLREFRLPAGPAAGLPVNLPEGTQAPAPEEFQIGSAVTVEIFKPGDRVDVTGRSTGFGFQGGFKRWNWKGGPATHGSMSHRAPGSIGSSTDPSRVFKGHHLPGHMGNRRVTTQWLEVVRVDKEQNLLLVKGAVPGTREALILVRKSRKPAKAAPVHLPASKKKAPQQAQPSKAPAQKEKKGGGKG